MKNIIETRLCKHCGSEFVPKRVFQKFCHKNCQMASYYLKLINKRKK